jgi:hypothetical protein
MIRARTGSNHKPTCHADERSSGLFKLVQMFSVNPVLMGYLKVGIVFECGLLDNPRIGFDTPFLARIEIAIEPSDVLNFGGLYVNDPTVEEKLQGMLQVNAITAWQSPSMRAPLTPKRLNTWREARARCNAEGFAEDPVGLIEFVGRRRTADSGNSMTAELHIPTMTLAVAMTHTPFTAVSAFTGIRTEKPLSAASCLESVPRSYATMNPLTMMITMHRFIDSHIRADKQNQLRLRTEMTEQDKEVIRAAGRDEDTFSTRILKEKMQREQLYAGCLQLMLRVSVFISDDFSRLFLNFARRRKILRQVIMQINTVQYHTSLAPTMRKRRCLDHEDEEENRGGVWCLQTSERQCKAEVEFEGECY